MNLSEESGAGPVAGGSAGENLVPSLDLLSSPPRVAVDELEPEGREVSGVFLGGDLDGGVERGGVLSEEEEGTVEGLGPSLSFTNFFSFPAFLSSLAFFSSIFSFQSLLPETRLEELCVGGG